MDKKHEAQNVQKRAKRKGRLYTPASKQARVIAASLAGKTKSAIAREEDLRRGTVARILSQPEVQQLLSAYRQQALALVPLCLEALKAKLLRSDGKPRRNADWRMLTEILKGTQVLISKQEQEIHETKDEFAERSDDELRYYIEYHRFPDSGPAESLPGNEMPPGA